MNAEELLGSAFAGALGMPWNDRRTGQGFSDRDIGAELAEARARQQYNPQINIPIKECPECPHCKKIKREETLKAMEIAQQLLDKKAKYEKRCKNWVKKIRKLSRVKVIEEA